MNKQLQPAIWCTGCRAIIKPENTRIFDVRPYCEACFNNVFTAPVDVAWVDDNDGRGPVKLSNSVRCF